MESSDLIKDCQTYQERFELVKDEILCNRCQYEYHSEVLDKAMDNMNNAKYDNFDNVAPNAEHLNKQDCAVKQKPSELFGCFDPGKNKHHSQYDLLDDIGIFPRNNDNEELLMKRMSDNDYYALVRSLNEEQRQFFYHVLHSVKTKDDPLRLFLSGGAGVGKSTVTNALYEALVRYLNSIVGENPDDVKVVKTAPTGKAAFNIKGNTLHSAFTIPANRGFEYCALDSDRLNTIRTQLKKLNIIFIDEISMVGSGMFNFLNLRLQQIMGTNKPFGGISVITVGDLFQLKPVFDKWIFENSQYGYNAFATNIWTEYFTLFELTEIMRQKEDKQFAELLNCLREGKHSDDDIAILKRLLNVTPESDNYPINTTHLFTTNASVDAHNNALYALSRTDKAQIKAVDIIIGDISDDLKKQVKNKIPDDATKTMGLYSLVSVATEAKYDLTTNIDVTDGLTNGAECIVENIDYRVENSTRPSIIWVSFPYLEIGKKWCKEHAHLYNTGINKNWTPILEVTKQFQINKKSKVQILRRQFPLRPAAAKTIHHCQGDTLDEAVVNFPTSTREHMHYVGLSRVRNSSSLHVLSLNEKKIKVSEKVKNEMSRLRREASLKPLAVLQVNLDSPQTKTVLFQNVRSLHLHIHDVQTDYNIQKADVNIFVETKLCLSDRDDTYELPGFTLYRNDFNQSIIRTSYGTAVYIKNYLNCTEIPYRFNTNDIEITVTVLNDPVANFHIVGIYRSKIIRISHLIEALTHLHNSVLMEPTIPTVLLTTWRFQC